MRVVDLGCGTGKLTRELHTRLAARETVGIDRSQRMLDADRGEARARAALRGRRQIESFPSNGARYDLILSNAALHWVEHHDALFERLVAGLEPNGQLAVQMPAMHDEASHLVAHELIGEEPFRSGMRRLAQTAAGPRAGRVRAPALQARLARPVGPAGRPSSCAGGARRCDRMGEGDAAGGVLAASSARPVRSLPGRVPGAAAGTAGRVAAILVPVQTRILIWGQRSDA